MSRRTIDTSEDRDRCTEIRKLWMTFPKAEKGKELGPLNFYRWLKENRPALLKSGSGDIGYQSVRACLLRTPPLI